MASRTIKQRVVRWLALLLIAWLPGAVFSERGPAPRSGAPVAEDPNNARVIVKFRAGSALVRSGIAAGRAQHAGPLGQRLSLPLADGRPLGPHTQGLHGKGLSSTQLAARLTAQPDVEWAVVDQRRHIHAVVPNDPYYAANQTGITPLVGQWYLRAPDSATVSAINAEAAWALTLGSPAITVAVLDTGVRFDHPDLVGKLWPGYDFVSDVSTASDGGGRDADASDPGDWTTAREGCGGSSASSWHGTETAGLIGAATDNGIGMAGVGRKVMLLPVRVLGKCGGYDSDIQAAMLWAAGLSSDPVSNPHPAQVINLSLGSTGSCGPDYQSILSQLLAARVTVVVAAGNETGLAVNTPANCPGAIAVAGLRHAGTKVGYSSIGPEVAIAAPAGNCVNTASGSPCLYSLLTTRNTGTTAPGANSYSDSYTITVGTSFAAPLVAGTAALMLSVDPTLTSAQVKAALQVTARPFPTTGGADAAVLACRAPSTIEQLECYCTTKTCGAGMLDAGAAVARAQASPSQPNAVISLANAAATVGDPVTLNGSASSATAGRTIAGFQWAIASGAGLASFTGATDGSSVTLAATAVGTVVISLTVTDSVGATRTVTQSVNIAAAPVASIASASVNATAGATLGLNGSGSSAATGRSIVAYQWAIASGAALANFSGATNTNLATLATSAAGTVVVSLTVTDSAGAVRSATQAINVAAAPTAAIALSAAIPTAGSAVSLSGLASSAAAGRTIIGYQWAIISGATAASFTGASNAATAVLATRAAGTVVVSLTVIDSAGGVRTITQSIEVVAAPTALITVSATPASAGASITLDASASAAGAGRSIAAYQWTLASGAGLANFTGPTTGKTVTLATTSAGTVVVSLTVTDSAGVTSSTSQSISIAYPLLVQQAINLQDAVAILRLIVGLDLNSGGPSVTPYQLFAADFDGNGKIELADAIAVLKRVVGLDSPSPQWLFFNASGGGPVVVDPLNPGQVPALKAGIGSSAAANVGLVAVLRGDVVGSSLSHVWALDARPAGSVAVLKDSTAAMAVFTVDLAGDYGLTLTVTDASSNSASATATLTAAVANTGPVSGAEPTRRFALGSGATADAPSGMGSPPAGGGGALGIGWLIGLAAAVGLLARRRT